MKRLALTEDQLKARVSKGEIKALREGTNMVFDLQEVERLAMAAGPPRKGMPTPKTPWGRPENQGTTGKYLFFEDVMKLLGVDDATLKRFVSTGELRAYRGDSNRMRFRADDVEMFQTIRGGGAGASPGAP